MTPGGYLLRLYDLYGDVVPLDRVWFLTFLS